VRNVMAHAQKPDFVFPRTGRVHLNRWGRQFSRLLAADVCASAWVMLDNHVRKWRENTGYPLNSPVSPSLPLPCVNVCQQVPNELYTAHAPHRSYYAAINTNNVSTSSMYSHWTELSTCCGSLMMVLL